MATYPNCKEQLEKTMGSLEVKKVAQSAQQLTELLERKGFDSARVARTLEMIRTLVSAVGIDHGALNKQKMALDKDISGVHDENSHAIKERLDRDLKAADAANEAAQARAKQERLRLEGVKANLDDDYGKENRRWEQESFFHRHASKTKLEHEQILDGISRQIDHAQKRLNEENRAAEAAKDRRRADREKAQQTFTSANNKDNGDFAAARKEAQAVYEHLSDHIDEIASGVLENLIPHEAYQRLVNQVEAYRPSYETFIPREAESYERPGGFYLGMATTSPFDTIDGGQAQAAVGERLVSRHMPSYLTETTGEKVRVRLPMPIELSRGLQLVITPQGGNQTWVNDALRNLTIRLLMAYPPTMLQLTMVDPHLNGQSFTGIRNIVDRAHENVISGGIVVEESSIVEAMSALRKRQKHFNENYGQFKTDEYFMRKAVQAVIINDFPNGFTRQSLSELTKLMEGGRAYGMIFAIGVNPAYVGEFESDPNYQKIMQDKQIWHLEGGRHSLQRAGSHIEFDLADENEVADNSTEILRRLHDGIVNATSRIERFDSLLPGAHDQASWRHESAIDGVHIPIGIAGAAGPIGITIGRPGADTRHHGLIAGPTGAGKTTLLHTMIMSTLVSYSAEEVQLVLIDFKEGTEFRGYAGWKIPSIRSITTTTEPELALAALRDVLAEWHRRADAGMSDYAQWRRDPATADIFMPRIIILFDEVQSLFDASVPTDIRTECASILKWLVEKGRALGVHLFLASQTFDGIAEVGPLVTNMHVRVCLKESGTGGILEDASQLYEAPAGSAILNEKAGEATFGNQLLQVALLADEEKNDLLVGLSEIYADPEVARRLSGIKTRLLFTNIEDDPDHPFNRLIDNGTVEGWSGDTPRLRLGNVLSVVGKSNPYELSGRGYAFDMEYANLLLIGRNQDAATRTVIATALTCCLDSVGRHDNGMPASDEVIICNFTEGSNLIEDVTPQNGLEGVGIESLYSLPLVRHVATTTGSTRRRRGDANGKGPLEAEVDRLYDLLTQRSKALDEQGDAASFDDIILVLYGFDNARRLTDPDVQQLGARETTIEKLQQIISQGADCDIYTILWSQTAAQADYILGYGNSGISCKSFPRRIVFNASKEELEALTSLDQPPATKSGVAFFDVHSSDRFYLCPYDIPQRIWFESFSDAYSQLWVAAGHSVLS